MDALLHTIAGTVALAIELFVVVVVGWGCIVAAATVVHMAIAGFDQERARGIWIRLAGVILLALEFALAADLVRTVIAPSWEAIGRLAAIAAIRTLLSVFLARDIEAFGNRLSGQPPAPHPRDPH